jgi:hypothetical protein
VTGGPDTRELVSRRALRHLILRRRNERIAAQRDDQWPVTIYCHPETHADLLTDGDPLEQMTMDFLGGTFMRIPLLEDQRLAPGEFVVDWPPPLFGHNAEASDV